MPAEGPGLRWQSLVVRGLVALVFGVVVMAWPQPTVGMLAVTWGLWAWAEGLIAIHEALVGTATARLLQGAVGVFSMLAGALALASPELAAAASTWILGAWLVGRGGLDVVRAFRRSRDGGSGLLVAGATVSLALGALFLTHPGRAALNITWLLGLVVSAWGLATVVVALLARHGWPGRETGRPGSGTAGVDPVGPAGPGTG